MRRHFLVSQTQKLYEQNPLIKVKKRRRGFDRKIVQVDVTLRGNWKKKKATETPAENISSLFTIKITTKNFCL